MGCVGRSSGWYVIVPCWLSCHTEDVGCYHYYHNEMPGCVVVFELYDWVIMLYGYYTEGLPVIPLQNVHIADPGFYVLTTIPRKYMLTGYKSVATLNIYIALAIKITIQ